MTKQWVTPASQRASKKAKDVVYILSGVAVVVGAVADVDKARVWDPVPVQGAKVEVERAENREGSVGSAVFISDG